MGILVDRTAGPMRSKLTAAEEGISVQQVVLVH